MGYIMTQQRALEYSPYFILYGRHPVFPAKIQDLEDQPLPGLDDPEALRLFLDARGQIFQNVMPLALRNLAIAQHRDKVRFMKVRGTPWNAPKTYVEPRDFVLVKRPTEGTLDVPSRPHILQVVKEEFKSGGSSGARCSAHRGADQECGSLFPPHP